MKSNTINACVMCICPVLERINRYFCSNSIYFCLVEFIRRNNHIFTLSTCHQSCDSSHTDAHALAVFSSVLFISFPFILKLNQIDVWLWRLSLQLRPRQIILLKELKERDRKWMCRECMSQNKMLHTNLNTKEKHNHINMINDSKE